jgi:hypothetical protein
MAARCPRYAVAVFSLPVFLAAAATSAAQAQTRATIELFTSQGCSSCPPADKLLGEFAADPNIIPISLPIDYWDYLGWKDTLADPRNTVRQKAYAKVRGDHEVYTPQVVINGSMHALGSDKAAIEQTIAQSHHNPAVLSMPVKISVNGDQIVVVVPEHTGAEVWLGGLARVVTVPIKRGENHGKTLTYYNVARRWLQLGPGSGAAKTYTVPIRELDAEGVNAVTVLVQSGNHDKPSAMLGAAMASIK